MQTISLSWEAIQDLPFPDSESLQHMRLEFGEDLQGLSDTYLRAATDWAEGVLHRSLIVRKHVWNIRRFPWGRGELYLPRGKTDSVESIVYYDSSGPVTLRGPSSSVQGTDYQEDLTSDSGGLLMPKKGESWPSVDSEVINPVQITFDAGFAVIPKEIATGIYVYATDRLEMPSAPDVSGDTKMAETLISPWAIAKA